MFRVTIRTIEYLEDNDLHYIFFDLHNAIFLGAPARCLVASNGPSSNEKIVAAQGWIKILGLSRREFMKANGAPAHIIEVSTSVDGILKNQDFTPAPGCLCPYDGDEASHWILDNRAESWLISVTRIPARVGPA
jgi:hypothetical protein